MRKFVSIVAAVVFVSGCASTTVGGELVADGYTLSKESIIPTTPKRTSGLKKRCTYTNGGKTTELIVARTSECAQ